MKNYLLFFLLITVFSCKEKIKTDFFEGDIYITLINVYNPNTLVPKDRIEELKHNIINFNSKDKTRSEIEMTEYFLTLIDNNLFEKPNFQLQLENEEIINVYVGENEYSKLKKELINLDRDSEKITVKFEGLKISNGIYNRAIYSATNITSVEKTAGKTDWDK